METRNYFSIDSLQTWRWPRRLLLRLMVVIALIVDNTADAAMLDVVAVVGWNASAKKMDLLLLLLLLLLTQHYE